MQRRWAPNYTQYYKGYVAVGMYTNQVSALTPVALVVNVSNDMYVLPAAFFVAPNGAPTLTNLQPGTGPNGSPTLNVSGANLSGSTRFVFDGTPVAATSNSDGSYTLLAPPAPAGFSSAIEALNSDGQTSGQAIPSGIPPQYQYNYSNPASITNVSPAFVLPGIDAMITINGNNTNFNSQSVVGFGSSDIVVKQVFVMNPLQLLVNVSVNSQAPLAISNLTVTTGLQIATFSPTLGTGAGMQIAAMSPGQITLQTPIVNAATGLPGTPAGGVAQIGVVGIPQTGASQILTGWVLTIGPETVTSPTLINGNQIQVPITVNVPNGAAQVQLTSPNGTATPVVFMKIDVAPPVISSVSNASGAAITATQQVRPGDLITLNISGLSDGTPVNPQAVCVTGGGFNTPSAFNIPIAAYSDSAIQILIPTSTPNGTLPVNVGNGTRVSAPVFLSIHN